VGPNDHLFARAIFHAVFVFDAFLFQHRQHLPIVNERPKVQICSPAWRCRMASRVISMAFLTPLQNPAVLATMTFINSYSRIRLMSRQSDRHPQAP